VCGVGYGHIRPNVGGAPSSRPAGVSAEPSYCASCFFLKTRKTAALGSLFSTDRCKLGGAHADLVISKRTLPSWWLPGHSPKPG
jgi:hypothetical protein